MKWFFQKFVNINGKVFFIAFTLFIFACFAFFFFKSFNSSNLKSSVKLGEPFNLTSHKNESISEKILLNKSTILFFGFTHCPEVCPTTLYEITSWIDELDERKEDIQAIFITLDPKRDTHKVLKEYLSNFDNLITGITGPEENIIKLAKSWGIYRKVVNLDNNDYTIDHTATVFLLNNDSSINGTITYREPFEVSIAKVKKLLESNSN